MPHPSAYAHKILIAFILATAAYVLMAWYDVLFDCNDRLKPTLLGWMSGYFKPPYYRQEFDELPLKYQKVVRTFDIVVLIVLLGLLVYPYIAFRK